MKYIVSYIAALFACGVAIADTTATTDNSFHLDFNETVGIYSFDNGTIVEAKTEVGFELNNWLTLSATLPIYNDESVTGLGDVGVFATVNLVNGKCDFLSADSAIVNGLFGVGIPLDGDYSSDNFYATVGGDAHLGWGSWTFGVAGQYSFVDGGTYVPQLGGFIDGDWASVSQSLTYKWTDWTFGVKAEETWSDNGGNIFTLGPTVAWSITDTIYLNGEVGFVVADEDLVNGDGDLFVGVGLGFAF